MVWLLIRLQESAASLFQPFRTLNEIRWERTVPKHQTEWFKVWKKLRNVRSGESRLNFYPTCSLGRGTQLINHPLWHILSCFPSDCKITLLSKKSNCGTIQDNFDNMQLWKTQVWRFAFTLNISREYYMGHMIIQSVLNRRTAPSFLEPWFELSIS